MDDGVDCEGCGELNDGTGEEAMSLLQRPNLRGERTLDRGRMWLIQQRNEIRRIRQNSNTDLGSRPSRKKNGENGLVEVYGLIESIELSFDSRARHTCLLMRLPRQRSPTDNQ